MQYECKHGMHVMYAPGCVWIPGDLLAYFIRVSSSRSRFFRVPAACLSSADLPQYAEVLGFASLFYLFCQARMAFLVCLCFAFQDFLCIALFVLSCPELAL